MSESAAWTIQKIIDWSIGFLREKGSPSARLDSELLLSHALGCTRIQLYTGFDKPLTVEEREPFKKLLLRRAHGEPVAYITGLKEFMGLSLQVTSDVLIPRPDTEVLVEKALLFCKSYQRVPTVGDTAQQTLAILDIGTGSGCIALALAKQLPMAQIIGWDISSAALVIAERNRMNLGLQKVHFECHDALLAESWLNLTPETFDLIVSNPPYIARHEEADLPHSVIHYEPRSALIADDGLTFYRVFALHAARALKRGGTLMVEIGSTQGESVLTILREAGWCNIEITRDYSRLERVMTARRP